MHDPGFMEYAVIHFAATPFTEEGLDIVTRERDGLSDDRLAAVKEELQQCSQVQSLLTRKALFEVSKARP